MSDVLDVSSGLQVRAGIARQQIAAGSLVVSGSCVEGLWRPRDCTHTTFTTRLDAKHAPTKLQNVFKIMQKCGKNPSKFIKQSNKNGPKITKSGPSGPLGSVLAQLEDLGSNLALSPPASLTQVGVQVGTKIHQNSSLKRFKM